MPLPVPYPQGAGIDMETGKVDIGIWMTGKPKSQREKIQKAYDRTREDEGTPIRTEIVQNVEGFDLRAT